MKSKDYLFIYFFWMSSIYTCPPPHLQILLWCAMGVCPYEIYESQFYLLAFI